MKVLVFSIQHTQTHSKHCPFAEQYKLGVGFRGAHITAGPFRGLNLCLKKETVHAQGTEWLDRKNSVHNVILRCNTIYVETYNVHFTCTHIELRFNIHETWCSMIGHSVFTLLRTFAHLCVGPCSYSK